jgi:hypothetical protein
MIKPTGGFFDSPGGEPPPPTLTLDIINLLEDEILLLIPPNPEAEELSKKGASAGWACSIRSRYLLSGEIEDGTR